MSCCGAIENRCKRNKKNLCEHFPKLTRNNPSNSFDLAFWNQLRKPWKSLELKCVSDKWQPACQNRRRVNLTWKSIAANFPSRRPLVSESYFVSLLCLLELFNIESALVTTERIPNSAAEIRFVHRWLNIVSRSMGHKKNYVCVSWGFSDWTRHACMREEIPLTHIQMGLDAREKNRVKLDI